MRFLQISIAIFLFLLFFVWGAGNSYSTFANNHFFTFVVYFFIVLIPFSIPGVLEKFLALLAKLEKYSFFIFPIFVFVFAQYIWHDVFSGIPRVYDEINFRYLANAILDGSITSELHPHYEFFRYLYIIPAKTGSYSIYDIGYPLFLAPFLYFKVPFLFNPLLLSFSIYFLGRITEELYNRLTASIAMMLASFSLFLSLMGGTWMSHSFSAFLMLGATLFTIKGLKKNYLKNTVISALFISTLMFVRSQNAFFVLIAVLFYHAMFGQRKNFLKSASILGITILPFFLVFHHTHYIFSNSILTGKHSFYLNISEPIENCMQLGLGKGCRHATLLELPEEGLTFGFAAFISHLRLNSLFFEMFFHPLLFIFISILFLFKTTLKEFKKDFFVLFCFLIIFFTYFFYYFDGNVYGPRYYYEASFFLTILVARGILLFFNKFNLKNKNPLLSSLNLFSAFAVAGVIFQYTVTIPEVLKPYRLAFWGSDPLLYKALEEKGIKEGLIFINPHTYYSSGVATMNFHKIDDNSLIFARDLGFFQNRRLINYYPDKKVYVANFNNKEWNENKLPEIFEFKKKFSLTF